MIRPDMTMDYYAGCRDTLNAIERQCGAVFTNQRKRIDNYEAAVLEAMAQAFQADTERSVDGKKEGIVMGEWYRGTRTAQVSEMLGATLSSVTKTAHDQIDFVTADGRQFKMYHDQDCCEYVSIEDITGNLEDLVGTPLVQSEEVSNSEPPKTENGYTDESATWTFYKFATAKGYVTIRWYGSSNGYYSESVDFAEVRP